MNYSLFSIFDVKTQIFSQPFMQRTTSEAIRSFQGTCSDNNPNNLINSFPSDYSLYLIGSFDESTGSLASQHPQQIANATEFVKQ